MTWRAVDAAGSHLAAGRQSPAAALSGAPVATWPLGVVDDDGRQITFAEALGPGGDRVQELLEALMAGTAEPGLEVDVLATMTPAGRVELPLACVTLAEGVEAAGQVDTHWLAAVDRRRRWAALAAYAGIVAWAFLAGHPETLFFCLILVVVYAAMRLALMAGPARQRLTRLAELAGVTVLGAGLSAVQTLPFL